MVYIFTGGGGCGGGGVCGVEVVEGVVKHSGLGCNYLYTSA